MKGEEVKDDYKLLYRALGLGSLGTWMKYSKGKRNVMVEGDYCGWIEVVQIYLNGCVGASMRVEGESYGLIVLR